MAPDVDREALGRKVREVWIAWAREQPSPKPSWLVPWDDLSEPDKEVDRRIGEVLTADARRQALEEAAQVVEDTLADPVEGLRMARALRALLTSQRYR